MESRRLFGGFAPDFHLLRMDPTGDSFFRFPGKFFLAMPLRLLANCCVCKYTSVELRGLVIT